MSTIDVLINQFEPISLSQMDEVKLLNRMDTKFAFRAGQLPGILEQAKSSYYILDINHMRQQRYETLYFDTPEHLLYLNHHNKRMNRFKVRSRRYVDSDQCYFEIKIKTNKGRTVKERNRHNGSQEIIAGKQEQLLASRTKLTPAMLMPALWVDFSRITLVNHGLSERITIDTGITFRFGPEVFSYPGVVIAEVKQDRSGTSLLSHLLHTLHIPGIKISKYCLGTISLNHHIKHNNFKQRLIHLNTLNHDTR
jgi:hypothetical protein